MTHVMLIESFCRAPVESFTLSLLELLKFEMVDLTDFYMHYFGATESPSLNIHFEASRYETSDFLLNSGPALFLFLISPFIVLLFWLLAKKFTCWQRGQNYFKK